MTAGLDVLLVQMPFGTLSTPSLGLSLLKAELCHDGFSAQVKYFTFPFAKQIGPEFYYGMSNQEPQPTAQLGEWIFSGAMFGMPDDVRAARYFSEALPQHLQDDKQFLALLRDIQASTAGFSDWCAEQILALRPAIVGFSTVFQQNMASLSVARRIKEASPGTFVVMGGANCEGIMGPEMARSFPFLDAVVSGEGDLVFPQLVRRMKESRPFEDLQGVYTAATGRKAVSTGKLNPAPPVTAMDDLPYADYTDFFETCSHYTFDASFKPKVLFETSRGCWWGQISHCTFCGLNADTMNFRSKSPERAIAELTHLTKSFPDYQLGAVDNILDLRYFKEVLPELTKSNLKFDLFYEIKPNLRKEQVETMHRAGITSVQPGLENLSTKVLEQMGKGVKALQNIQLLKWCKEFGIHVYWNLLWGFPGEDAEEYAKTAKLIPWLTHLVPPSGTGQVRLDRFSPHFTRAESFGFVNVRPFPGYFHVYPFESESVGNLAYFFRFDLREERSMEYVVPVAQQVLQWRKDHASSDHFYIDKNDSLLIWDLRPAALHPVAHLTGVARALYLKCDAISTIQQLKQTAEEFTKATYSIEDIEKAMTPLVNAGYVLREKQSYLALAARLGVYQPKGDVYARFLALLQNLGAVSDPRGIRIRKA